MSCSNRIDDVPCPNESKLLLKVSCSNSEHELSTEHEMCRSCMDLIYQPGRVVHCACGGFILYSEPIPLFTL